jgi:hypothetical protein
LAVNALPFIDDLQMVLKPQVVSDYCSRRFSMSLGDPRTTGRNVAL